MSAVVDQLKRPHRWSVAEYHRMGEVGFFAPNARVELIDGEVFDMAPIGSRYFATVNRLAQLFDIALGGRAIVSSQGPITLGDLSEPQPDIALLKPRADFYRDALPTAADVLLLIEVADTTLASDVNIKAPLYARHGIAEVWIVDLRGHNVRVLREPRAGSFQQSSTLRAPGVLSAAALPDVKLDLARLFD